MNRTSALGILILLSILETACSQVSFAPQAVSASCISPGNCGALPGLPGAREKALMSSGLVARNSSCVMCHMRITGDVSGFGTLTFRDDSQGQIFGNVYAADIKLQKWTSGGTLDTTFTDGVSDPALIESVLPELKSENLVYDGTKWIVKPGEVHNTFGGVSFLGGGDFYSMTSNDPVKRAKASDHIIRDTFGNRPIIHEDDFPVLDPVACISNTNGFIRLADGTKLHSPLSGNTVLVNGKKIDSYGVGTAANAYNDYDMACPDDKTLEINGEVVVKGELVLSGCIKGKGTIYSTGNIYIPDDIKLIRSPFPFVASVDDAVLGADVAMKVGKDMLSLGSAKYIMVGRINNSFLSHPINDPSIKNNIPAMTTLYSWMDQSVYESAFLKRPLPGSTENAPVNGHGAVSLVEANLYANNAVVAVMTQAQNTNIVINGSVLTPNFVALASAFQYLHRDNMGNPFWVNPFNGQTYDMSQLNADFRLKFTRTGFKCLRLQTH